MWKPGGTGRPAATMRASDAPLPPTRSSVARGLSSLRMHGLVSGEVIFGFDPLPSPPLVLTPEIWPRPNEALRDADSVFCAHRFPAHPIQHPAPRNFLAAIDRWWRERMRAEHHRLSSIGLGEPLEYPALFLDPPVIGKQAKTVLQRVELELPVHIVAVPIAEPTHAGINGCQNGLLQPFCLLLFVQRFDAGVELLRPNWLPGIAGICADQSSHRRQQLRAGRIHGAPILQRS